MTGSGARFTSTSQAAAMAMEIAHETSCGARSSSHIACAGLNRIAVIVVDSCQVHVRQSKQQDRRRRTRKEPGLWVGSAEAAATDTAYESSFSNLSRVNCVMITLPFDFDTTDAWRIIVRLVLGLLTLLVLLVFGAVIAHQLAAAAQLSLTLAVLGFICRRARAVPMGALGTIT